MKAIQQRLLSASLALLAASSFCRAAELQEVASFPNQQVTCVGVSKTGRVFVNFPKWSDDHTISVAALRAPAPDVSIDSFHENLGDDCSCFGAGDSSYLWQRKAGAYVTLAWAGGDSKEAASHMPAPVGKSQRSSDRNGSRELELEMRGVRISGEQARDPAVQFVEVPALQIVRINSDGRFRLATDTRYPGDIRFKFLTVGSPAGSDTIDELQWRDGVEIQHEGASDARVDYADLLFLAPTALLEAARERKPVETADSLSGEYNSEAFVDAAGRPATLAIDKSSGHVVHARSPTRLYRYENYQGRDGFSQPERVIVQSGDQVVARWSVDARIKPSLPGLFTLPRGYVAKKDRGALRASSVGPGTYRVDGAPSGYHTAFSVGSHSIAVYDAPIGVEEAQQVKSLIERTAPGRRLAYVVISHTHGDHVAGLPVSSCWRSNSPKRKEHSSSARRRARTRPSLGILARTNSLTIRSKN